MIGEVLTATALVYDEMENISVDETSIQAFFKFKKTERAEISFITNSRVYSLLITQAKMQTEINNN